MAINAAGSIEVALDRAARRLRVRPATVVVGSAALVSLAILWAVRGRHGVPAAGRPDGSAPSG